MPHDRDNKEWLHLRDAICLGNVRHIVDQLREEGILIPEADLALDLSIIKNKAGVDACGVVDKKTFHDSIVSLTQDWIGWGKKTGRSFLGGGIPDSVFEKMVGRASGRIKADPSHYTAETPQGALEGMEERLVQDAQFRQRMAPPELREHAELGSTGHRAAPSHMATNDTISS